MIKVTKNGKTIVGNNEDQMNPNSRIWFEKGSFGKYGVAYVGFDNLYPQGGMNEVGLVFDGFTQSYRIVADTLGKIKISALDLEKKIMQECGTVEEVKILIEKYNIDFWAGAVMRYIDKTGKYLYVDGDSLVIGNEDIFTQTNKRPYESKECWRYNKATSILKNGFETSVNYAKSIMDSIHMDEKAVKTLYSTIYDLNEGKIYLYYFLDFSTPIIYDLEYELKKDDRVLNIPELFPDNVFGKKYLDEYNKILKMILDLGSSSDTNKMERYQNLKKSIFNSFIDNYPFFYKIFHTAQYYLYEEINYERAILLLKLNVEIYPNYYKAFDDIGEAFFADKQYQLALKNYQRSLELYPNNSKAKSKIEEIIKLM
jgi:tetratricopeptide (TPR) repeat protein